MENLIKKHWWKALGVLLMIYAIIAGLLVPLKPGITLVTPTSGNTGEVLTIEVHGYNTHFDEAADTMQAWLKLDTVHNLAASKIDVVSPTLAKVTFAVPDYLPSDLRHQDFSLVIDNAKDGYAVRPNAVIIAQDSIDPQQGLAQWPHAQLTGLHETSGMSFPFRPILDETIRNTYFHVSLWFALLILLLAAVVYSIKYLGSTNIKNDYWASSLTSVGLLLGVLGLITGAIWAEYTWGAFWSWDIKQYTTLIALLIYAAYFVLRSSFPDETQRARVSAVYSIFAYVALIILLYVLPRLTDSLHPGNGGNPALGSDDLDNTMRMVFYPSIIGLTLVSCWISSLIYRAKMVEEKLWDDF